MRIHAHGTGATVLELMVTLAIAAILVTTGVPSFQNYLLRQHVRAAVNQLHHDLMLARSEAVYRNAVVIACPGAPESGVNDIIIVVVGLGLYAVFAFWAHEWLFGVRPFVAS